MLYLADCTTLSTAVDTSSMEEESWEHEWEVNETGLFQSEKNLRSAFCLGCELEQCGSCLVYQPSSCQRLLYCPMPSLTVEDRAIVNLASYEQTNCQLMVDIMLLTEQPMELLDCCH